MVYRFLEKDEKPKPTIAMDYSFGRKTVKSLVSVDKIKLIYVSFIRILLHNMIIYEIIVNFRKINGILYHNEIIIL